MIDLYFWPTGNGKKTVILLEELGLPYTIKPINIGRGDQLAPEFLKISPNGRMPAIVETSRWAAAPRCRFSNLGRS
jgi:GSH-dependent disulfide-bond oxidoreductase